MCVIAPINAANARKYSIAVRRCCSPFLSLVPWVRSCCESSRKAALTKASVAKNSDRPMNSKEIGFQAFCDG